MLTIEIPENGPQGVRIHGDGDTLGFIYAIRVELAADQIPPIIEVTMPDFTDPECSLSEGAMESFSLTMEVMRRHGVQVKLRPLREFDLEQNPEEQGKAEATLRQMLVRDV